MSRMSAATFVAALEQADLFVTATQLVGIDVTTVTQPCQSIKPRLLLDRNSLDQAR